MKRWKEYILSHRHTVSGRINSLALQMPDKKVCNCPFFKIFEWQRCDRTFFLYINEIEYFNLPGPDVAPVFSVGASDHLRKVNLSYLGECWGAYEF
jgi:hypothetical protein